MPYKDKEVYRAYQKEYQKQYYKDNPKKVKKIKRVFAKKYYFDHPEKIKKSKKRYNQTIKGKATKQRAKFKRRALLNNIINTLTAQEWITILKEYNFKCAYCGCEFTLFNRETKDHVIPISKGGDNTKENIVPACQSCNSKKFNKIF